MVGGRGSLSLRSLQVFYAAFLIFRRCQIDSALACSSSEVVSPGCIPPGEPPSTRTYSSLPSARSSIAPLRTRKEESLPRWEQVTHLSSTGAIHSPPVRHCVTPRRFRCSSKKVRRECASFKPPVPLSTSTQRAI